MTFDTKEAKTTQNLVKLARFGLFAVLLGRFSTGSSFALPAPTTFTLSTTLYHFVPHLTRKSLIVKRKLEGTAFAVPSLQLSTSSCG